MKIIHVFAVALLFATPGLVEAQQVKTNYDKTVDFSKYKTYEWKEGKPASNPTADRQIILEVDKQLQSKGFRRVEQDGELKITYYTSLDGNTNARMVEYMQGLDWSRWSGGGETYKPDVSAMPIARLVLDVIDGSRGKLVWRGKARDAYTANQAHARHRVNSAITKMFKHFPPSRS